MTRSPLRHRYRAALALLPALLLSGCGVDPGVSSGTAAGSSSAAGAGATGSSWVVATQGSATPSPRPSYPTASPTPSSGFLPLGSPTPTRTPPSTCLKDTFNFSRIAGLEVTPGPGSAVLSWYNIGGYNLVEFRLYAISQDLRVGSQRDVGYLTVKPTTCGRVSATIGDLDRKTAYVFSVDAVVTRRSGDGTHAATVARSGAVATT